jgi:hypothetical protein
MGKLAFVGLCIAAGAVGAGLGIVGGKAAVKRLPDTFVFCGIRATKRAK